mmetsp:Transcript_16860/g.38665  ORF Transcript_16860/g.38665 Transcript_16860/m.38665 type:complete len:149 (+) Transcript_16860:107-553(+)
MEPPAETPTLKFLYQMKIKVVAPTVVPNGPKGSRYIFPIVSGTFTGADPDFHGTIEAPSADYAIRHTDGSGFTLKVFLVLKLHDDGILMATAEGRSERDADNPNNSKITSSATYETGVERFKWMNNQVIVGYGRKEGLSITIDYYQVV